MRKLDLAHTEEDRQYFEKCWAALFRELLGWGEARAAKWASDEIQRVGDNPFLTHEQPSWYIARLLVPDDIKVRVGPRFNHLRGVLDVAIHCRDPRGVRDALSPEFDWHAARERVRVIFDQARAGVDPADIKI